MKIQCEKCGRQYEVEESYIGQDVECECGHKWQAEIEDQKKYVNAGIPKKITSDDWLKLKKCPKCKQIYRVDFRRNTGCYFHCQCGQDVLIDHPMLTYKIKAIFRACFIAAFAVCLFFLLPGWLIFTMYSCATSPHKSTISRESGKIDAWVFTQYLVEQHLKSPKSEKFPFGGAQNHVEETVPGIYIIRSYVDAKNAFGAEIRQHFFCKLQRKSDGKFEVLQLTFQ